MESLEHQGSDLGFDHVGNWKPQKVLSRGRKSQGFSTITKLSM